MRICGIDSATKKTGISLFIDGRYETSTLIDVSSISVKPNKRINEMILNIVTKLTEYKPDCVYIEDSYMANNIQTTKELSYIIGAVRLFCLEHKIAYHLLMPSSWRSTIGIQKKGEKRSNYKKLCLLYVRKKYNVNAVTDDVSDSICIGEAGTILENDEGDLFL